MNPPASRSASAWPGPPLMPLSLRPRGKGSTVLMSAPVRPPLALVHLRAWLQAMDRRA